MAQKLFVTGDINGQFRDFFAKVTKLHATQKFALGIIAGNFFADDHADIANVNAEAKELLEGKIQAPLPIYFTLGRQILPETLIERLEANNGELCPNVFAIGRKGRVKTSEKLKIVAISGRYVDGSVKRPESVFASGYTDKDAISSIGYNETDILVTSDWPTDIRAGCRMPCAGPISQREVQPIAHLTTALKPRYHFSTSLAFYERTPFYHQADEPEKPVTRFIALAPFGNRLQEKWIYAFLVDPTAKPSAELPPGTTPSPLGAPHRKRKLESQEEAYNGHRGRQGDHHQEEHRGKRRKPLQPAQCYFCLSNPACETHMIASIGNDSYMTVAKGPLPTKTTFPDLGIPAHMLIIPLVHTPTIAAISSQKAQDATLTEMTRYKDAVLQMIYSKAKDEAGNSKLGAVVFDISRAGGVHNHWQLLPVPVYLVTTGTIEACFKSEADGLDYPAFITEQDKVAAVEQGNCFKVEICAEGYSRRMAMPLDVSYRFDLQFGRAVVGKLLGLAKRAHWKDCGQSKADEENDTAQFKDMFKEFDFSLNE